MSYINEQATKALDVLESSEVLHEFDDSVTLLVDRELWEKFIGFEHEPECPAVDGFGCRCGEKTSD